MTLCIRCHKAPQQANKVCLPCWSMLMYLRPDILPPFPPLGILVERHGAQRHRAGAKGQPMRPIYLAALARYREYVDSFGEALYGPRMELCEATRANLRARRDHWHRRISWILRRLRVP